MVCLLMEDQFLFPSLENYESRTAKLKRELQNHLFCWRGAEKSARQKMRLVVILMFEEWLAEWPAAKGSLLSLVTATQKIFILWSLPQNN